MSSNNCDCNSNIPLNINQYVDGIDQMMCAINAILESLSASCGGFNIDYSELLKDASDLPLLPGQSQKIDQLFECFSEMSPENKEKSKQYFSIATKVLNYLTKYKKITIYINCENSVQEFSLDSIPNDMPIECKVTLNFSMPSITFNKKDHKKIQNIICNSTSPGLIVQFHSHLLPEEFFNFSWTNTAPTDENGIPVFTIPENYEPGKPSKKVNAETGCPEAGLSHITTISGVECITENGKSYILYKIKDTYKKNDGSILEYIIKVDINQDIPFEVGFKFNNFTIQRVGVSDQECKKIKRAKDECCPTSTTNPPNTTTTVEPTTTTTIGPSTTVQPSTTTTLTPSTTAEPTTTSTSVSPQIIQSKIDRSDTQPKKSYKYDHNSKTWIKT